MPKTSPQRLRLLYLCLETPINGQASFVHMNEIASGLRRRGWDVDVAAPSYGMNSRRPRAWVRVSYQLVCQARAIKLLSRCDIVYVRAHPLACCLSMLARLWRRPIIHEVNGTYEDLYVAHPAVGRLRMLLDWVQRVQYRRATGLIAVTDRLAAWLEAEVRPRMPAIAVVPNGANTSVFTPNAHTDIVLPRPYAVFCGGLARWHSTDSMLAALASPAWPEGVALVVVGEGMLMPQLRAAAARDRRLVLLGRLPYEAVPGVLAGAVVSLVPINDPGGRSTAAGLAPLKLYESMACGVPVVATDFPGQAELVRTSGCGLVVPSDDGHALAEAVAQITTHRESARLMGMAGASIARAEHDWDERAASTDRFLRSLVDGHLRAPDRTGQHL